VTIESPACEATIAGVVPAVKKRVTASTAGIRWGNYTERYLRAKQAYYRDASRDASRISMIRSGYKWLKAKSRFIKTTQPQEAQTEPWYRQVQV